MTDTKPAALAQLLVKTATQLNDAPRSIAPAEAALDLAAAQVYATLALVEQTRVNGLIALHADLTRLNPGERLTPAGQQQADQILDLIFRDLDSFPER